MNEITSGTARAARSLERLRRDFPLEARLAEASPSARAAYAKILVHWLDADAPPAASAFPAEDLAELSRLDAVALTHHGVSAYPFSAGDTGISVRLRGRHLDVMCAIDALAVPLLAGTTITIEAMCGGCEKPIVLDARPDGSWTTSISSELRVRHPGRRDPGSPCCSDLCPTIRFVLAGCESGSADEYLSVDEAIAVARAMFAFQVPLIRAEQKRLAAASA